MKLDPDLDPRTFLLGDLRIGEISIHLPENRGAFQGDFDFRDEVGFVLRVSAGLDPLSSIASWLIQAIDPDTGELVQDPERGLLPPNDAQGAGAGFVGFSILPRSGLATGTEIGAEARVLLNTAPPQDTNRLTQVLDGQAPASSIAVEPLAEGGSDLQVVWDARDDERGSGVKHVTVYVAEDGGDYRIWQRRITDTHGIAVYEGLPGHSYEFLTLATDHAGNRELPPFGTNAPDDESSTNLGALPEVDGTQAPDLGPPREPSTAAPSNSLFVEAQAEIPSAPPSTRPSASGPARG